MSEILEDLKSNLTSRYSLERVVGRGGMATVYLARDTKHNRQVAVKVLKPENILLSESHAVVADFGIAKAISTAGGDALSLGGIQQIATEVGIPPEQVRATAKIAVGVSVEGPRRGLFRFSTKVDLGRVVEFELPEDGYEVLLEEIRSAMGEVGRINQTLGKSLSWNSLSFQNSLEGSGRLTHVMVSPNTGQTRIRITESAGVHSILAGAGVAMFGIVALAILKEAMALPGPIVAFGIGAALVAGGIGASALVQKFHERRQLVLTRLLDRLSGFVL